MLYNNVRSFSPSFMFGYRSLEKVARCLIFQFSTKQIRSKFIAFDTNNLLLFLARHKNSPLAISFFASALDFRVFLVQTTRLTVFLKNIYNFKRVYCCWTQSGSEYFRRSTNQEWVARETVVWLVDLIAGTQILLTAAATRSIFCSRRWCDFFKCCRVASARWKSHV